MRPAQGKSMKFVVALCLVLAISLERAVQGAPTSEDSPASDVAKEVVADVSSVSDVAKEAVIDDSPAHVEPEAVAVDDSPAHVEPEAVAVEDSSVVTDESESPDEVVDTVTITEEPATVESQDVAEEATADDECKEQFFKEIAPLPVTAKVQHFIDTATAELGPNGVANYVGEKPAACRYLVSHVKLTQARLPCMKNVNVRKIASKEPKNQVLNAYLACTKEEVRV